MRNNLPFFYSLLLIFLTAFPASARAHTLWQQGGLYPGEILDIRYTPDSKNLMLVCTGTRYDQPFWYQVCRYNIADRRLDTLLILNSYHRPLLSPDTRLVLCDNAIDDTVRIWSVSQRQPIAYLALGGDVSEQGRVWTDDNDIVAVIANEEQTSVKRFNALNGVMESSFVITPTYSTIESVAQIAVNGKWVSLFTSDPTRSRSYTEIWNIHTREHTVWQRAQGTRMSAFDGRYMVYHSPAGIVTVYDIETHETITNFDRTPYYVGLLPEGYLAEQVLERNTDSQQATYTMKLIQLATGRRQSIPMFDVDLAVSGLQLTLCFSRDYISFAAVINIPENYDELIPSPTSTGFSIYSLPDSSLTDTWPTSGHIAAIRAVAISPDGNYGATAGDDLQTLLWNMKTGIYTGRLAGKGALAFSSDSTALVRANTRTSSLEKISLEPFTVIQTTALPIADVKTLRFSSDKRFLLCVAPSGIAVYSWPTLHPEYNISSAPDVIVDAGFTADANTLVIVTLNKNRPDEYTVHSRNANDGDLLSQKIFSGNFENQTVQLSHDGSLLVVSFFSRLTVYRISDGEIVRDISSQMYGAPSPTLSPDGTYIFLANRTLIPTGQDNITYYHVFKAFSLHNPTEDIMFDNTVLDTGSPSLTAMSPSGTMALYTCRNSYRAGRLYYTDLTAPTLPLISSDTRSLQISPIYTGIPSTHQIRLAISAPAPGIVTGIALSDPALVHTVSVHYSHALPDTVKAYDFNDFRAPVITLTINPVYAGDLSFSLLVAVGGYSWRDTLRIPVTATITGPDVTVSIEEIDFGIVPVGSRVERRFHLQNDHDTAFLYLTAARLVDTTWQTGLNIPEPLPFILKPRENLPVTVSYMPVSSDSLNAEFVLASNDPVRPEIRIPVRGRGATTVGVPDTKPNNTMRLAPNPVTSVLTISVPEAAQNYIVELVSAEGKCVFNRHVVAGEQAVTLDTRMFPTGMYYCRIITPSGITTKPVSILH